MSLGVTRRTFIESAVALLALLGIPKFLRAGTWPESAFEATDASDALVQLYGTDTTQPSEEIDLGLPLVAEDGTMVPISVATRLQGVQSISIVVENNPRPLAAYFELASGTLPEIACRIKMAETSDVHAVVQTAFGLYRTSARVKVTLGGCA